MATIDNCVSDNRQIITSGEYWIRVLANFSNKKRQPNEYSAVLWNAICCISLSHIRVCGVVKLVFFSVRLHEPTNTGLCDTIDKFFRIFHRHFAIVSNRFFRIFFASLPELYFLIAKFLSQGPFQNVGEVIFAWWICGICLTLERNVECVCTVLIEYFFWSFSVHSDYDFSGARFSVSPSKTKR